MNITQYYSEEDNKATIYRGRATLQKGYTVVNADELFYRFVGSNSAKPFPLMVHPEDADSVREALEKLGEEPERLLFRLLCDNGSYRYMYGVIHYNGREENGFRFIDVELLDIMRIHHKFDEYNKTLIKYRKFMTHSNLLYFEYIYATGRLTIFEYINERSVIRFRDNLSDLQKRISESEEYTFKQKAEFESLQEYLTNFSETMELELDGELFGLDCGYMHLNGGIAYLNNAKEMMVATITVTGEVKRDDKYYMSPHAFDNATNVYNKRAIKELAMELIAKSNGNRVLLSVMDIDDFKNINDTFGHMKGDEIIAKVAEIIKTTLGKRGYVGRFGGDEFMVVTEKVKDVEDFGKIFKTIRKNVQWSCGEMLGNMEVTLSQGVASYPDHASNYDELFHIADKCLYIAKAKGKNRVINYKPELHASFDMAKVSANKIMPMTFGQSCEAVVKLLGNSLAKSMDIFEQDIKGFIRENSIDRVIIASGPNLKTSLVIARDGICADTPEVLENMSFWNKERAAALFDSSGVLVKNRVQHYEDTCPEVYAELSRQGTESFVAVKVCMDEGQELLIFYDMVCKHRKWSSNEIGLLHIAAWIIARRYLRIAMEADKLD